MKNHSAIRCSLLAAAMILSAAPLIAEVPLRLNDQGRIVSNGVNFSGAGLFKSALVDAHDDNSWTNDGTKSAEPDSAVPLPATGGLCSAQLGDTSLQNMTAIPREVFDSADVRLRVWFNDGTTGFQQLVPDQRIASVGFAIMANSVSDCAVTAAKLADGQLRLLHGQVWAANGALVREKRYDGPAHNWDAAGAVVVNSSGNVIVTGTSTVQFNNLTGANHVARLKAAVSPRR